MNGSDCVTPDAGKQTPGPQGTAEAPACCLTREEVEAIREAAAASNKVATMLEAKLIAYDQRLQKCEEQIKVIEKRHEKEVSQLKDKLKKMQEEIEKRSTSFLEEEINNLEQYSRRSHLRIRGLQLPTGRSHKESVAQFCARELQVPVRPEDLDDAHPIPSRSIASTPPRSTPAAPQVIVRFHARELRDRVIKARSCLKGKGITISEDLTSKNQQLLSELRTKENVENAWSWQGKIFALHHHERKPRRYRYGATFQHHGTQTA